ncbi:MAG: RHS repeat-associated core domain-containing protein [Thiobacillus sp.]
MNNLWLPGQYYDRETGMQYNYFRDYDPTTGRYVEADPIGLAGGLNLYSYVGGNPTNAIDPRGLVKLYGSWCGPDWTGGFSKPYDQLDDVERSIVLPPVDDLDRCCQVHDITYASCRKQFPCDPEARKQCFKNADRSLNSCSANSHGDASSQILLFGNAKKRIADYMKDSDPDPGANAPNCSCSTKHK